ncbi:MAG: pantoate--beta-alanine ligase [Chitinophagaceae bacterium]|nr:pantoate--beta-alanine ligase [Chitinophagaceae bacterium]
MILFKESDDLKKFILSQKQQGQKIGFVPTMGALHNGHLELIHQSSAENDITICSIFVNPTQFNDAKDFEKYPITIESDIEKLENIKCNVLFFPSVKEMYPDGITETKKYDLGKLETLFEGEFRPGHFQGVCVIVDKLLELVTPQNLYMGQKDFQQCMVIAKLISITGIYTKLHICNTLREKTGLAMSSRNERLSKEDRQKASLIFENLNYIKEHIQDFSFPELQSKVLDKLNENQFNTEYLKLIDSTKFEELTDFDFNKKMYLIIATHFGGVRLIDNIPIN